MHEMPLFANAWNAIVDTDNDAFRMNQTHLQLYIGRVIINWDLLFNPSSRNRAWGLSSLTVGYFMGAFIATYIHLVPANTCCVSCSLSPGGNTFIKPSLQWKPSCRCHHAPTHMKEVAINRIHREAFLLGKKNPYCCSGLFQPTDDCWPWKQNGIFYLIIVWIVFFRKPN